MAPCYTISYAALPLGKHEFDFVVESDFFSRFENSEVSEGRASVHVEANKLSEMMQLWVSIDGEVKVECDRCLDEYFQPIEFDGEVRVNFDGSAGDTDDDPLAEEEVMNMRAGDTELDLAQYIYESICLSIPMQRVHPDNEFGESTCNPVMLAKLKEYMRSEARSDGA